MSADFQTLDIIEENTRNDGSTYKEIGNLLHNGQAEYAVEKGMIKKVRILRMLLVTKNLLMRILIFQQKLLFQSILNGNGRQRWTLLLKKS